MATDSKTPIPHLMEQAQLLAMSPMIAPQMEQFWKAQEDILEETEAFSGAWFERRHEATKTALATVHRMNGTGTNPGAEMQSLAEWQQGSLQRLADDMQQWFELCARCTGRVTDAELEASRVGSEKVAKQAKAAARKHATPV